MRYTAPFGALVAGGLFGRAAAQAASYGSPEGFPTIYPDGWTGGVPDGSSTINSNSGSYPSDVSGDVSGGYPDGSVGYPDDESAAFGTCNVIGTTTATVFVTIQPTETFYSSGPSTDPGQGDESALTWTTPATEDITAVDPQTVVSPAAQTSVEAFTTMTIDIWGTGSGHSGDSSTGDEDGTDSDSDQSSEDGTDASTSGFGTPPSYTGASGPSDESSDDSPDDGSNGTSDVTWAPTASLPTGSPEGNSDDQASDGSIYGSFTESNQQASDSIPWTTMADQFPGAPSQPVTVVTDSEVHWVPGPDGPSQITVLSAHTISLGPSATEAISDVQSVPTFCITILGSDGKPTVVELPSGVDGLPISSTSASPWGEGMPGPQVVSSALGMPSAISTSPSAGTVPDTFPGDGSDDVTVCTSYTVLGADGLPTIVHSSYVVSPTEGSEQDSDAGVTDVSGDSGIITSTSFTYIGPDGLPTAIGSTWTIPTDVRGGITWGSALPVTTRPSTGEGADYSNGGVTTCTSFTIIGADGQPTVVESSWVVSPTGGAPDGSDLGSSAGLPTITDSGIGGDYPNGYPSGLVATCTSYTVIGADGNPTVVESSFLVPGPMETAFPSPSNIVAASNTLPTDVLSEVTPVSAFPYPSTPRAVETTTCISYTYFGSDGLPTVAESTWIIPGPVGTGAGFPQASDSLPTDASGQITGYPGDADGDGFPDDDYTTCTSYTYIGADGLPSVVETSWVVAASGELPAATSLIYPSYQPTPSITNVAAFPSSIPMIPVDIGQGNGLVTTTALVVGTDGIPTPLVQTIVAPPIQGATPGVSGVPISPPGPVVQNGDLGRLATSIPTLSGYGDPFGNGQFPSTPAAPAFPQEGGLQPSAVTIADGAAATSGSGLPLPAYGIVENVDSTLSASPGLPGSGVDGSPSDVTLWPASPVYGPVSALPAPQTPDVSTPCVTTTLRSGTWTNLIVEQTTTYTLKFPFTTLATVTRPISGGPIRRAHRRQESSLATPWSNATATSSSFAENTSLVASLSSVLNDQLTPSSPVPGIPAPSSSAMCVSGGMIGNTTVNFDSTSPGPLLNPSNDLWFSEGFLVAPPSSQFEQAYTASSGGQLVEFVPPALSPAAVEGNTDTAEIGVGPNAVSDCFRMDFYGASLGCAAQGNEQWCEFDIAAYSIDEATSTEQSIAWTETKRVPACPKFPAGECALTPIELDGYTNITSVLITLRVGLDLRVWWGDDFRFGWTDNSCEAAACRSGRVRRRAKRHMMDSALRRGVWHWTPNGLEELDEEYILSSFNH